MQQPGLDGIPPLPPQRPAHRPTKAEAKAHAAALSKAVMAGAKQRGHEGAQRAADHAERVSEGWTERACRLTLAFAKLAGSGGFLIEAARVYAEGQGLEAPPDSRAWGRIPLRLKRGEPGKRLESCGAAPAASSNHSLKTLWRLA